MNKIVTFGDIMIRLSTPSFERFSQAHQFDVTYGGVEANVASTLAYMGIKARHITRLPDNDIGRAVEAHFKKLNVDTSNFVWGGDRVGVYYLEQGIGSKAGKVIFDRMGSAFCGINAEMLDWEEILDGASGFHFSGIAPGLSKGSADACLEAIKVCRKNKIKVSADINYRKNLWQYGKSASEIMTELLPHVDVAFASVFDMQDQFGIPLSTKSPKEAFHASATELVKKFPSLQKVVTTFREVSSASDNDIFSLLYEQGETIQSKKHKVRNIVDRIGTGDAFAAGFLYGNMQQGWNKEYLLEFAMASMVLKHYIPGDQGQSSVDEIKYLADGNEVGRLMR